MRQASGPSARARATLLVLACALAPSGCSNDLDELFCEPECPEAAPDAGGDGAQPARLLPFLPDPNAVDECAECFEKKCEAEIANCFEDDACTSQLQFASECDDPGCFEEYRGEAGMAGASPFATDTLACKNRECASECQVGLNWACVGDFRWPKATVPFIEQRVRFGTSFQAFGVGNDTGARAALAGASVRICTSFICETASQVLDASNSALVQLPTGNSDGTFRGFFEVEDDEIGIVGTHYRVYWPPLARPGVSAMPIVPESYTGPALAWLPSPELAALWVYVGDCTQTTQGARIRVELGNRPSEPVAYGTPDGLSLEALETTAGAAFFPALSVSPALSSLPDSETVTVQAVWLSGREPVEEKVVARREVSLRKGWTTIVYLSPLAVGD